MRGDRVAIYMPMIPELPIAMLACARIGAIHSVVFGGFSAEALRDRINDCEAKVLITADGGYRRGGLLPLKHDADYALREAPSIEHVIVVRRGNFPLRMKEGRDHWYEDLVAEASGRLPRRGDGRRGPPLHPLHLRHHGQAQGRRAHHRRLPHRRPLPPCTTSST